MAMMQTSRGKIGGLIFDYRDWYERGDDPTKLVEQLMQLWWELGLDKDIELVASDRLYEKIQNTDYGKLTPKQEKH